MPERNIAIRVDEELFKKIKKRLAENGMTLKDYIISLIEEDLKENVHLDMKAVSASTDFTKDDLNRIQQVFDFIGDIVNGKYNEKE